ncbi:MAG: hypothetical protein RLZZ74_504 [Cyanobacteriota bacterium]
MLFKTSVKSPRIKFELFSNSSSPMVRTILDLQPTLIKSHPNYSNLCDYGAIAA